MAVVLGTNSGFVSVAPTADPAGSSSVIDNNSRVTKHTSPAGATKIIQVGWWCSNPSEEANFEIGLYAADGTVVPGEAGTRLYVTATNAKGITAGWKTAIVDWDITGSTDYWLGLQVDNTATATSVDASLSNGVGYDVLTSQSTLTNPYGGGAIGTPTGMMAVYAVYTIPESFTPIVAIF